MNDPQRQRKPWLLRIISLEGALAAFGLYSLGSGLIRGEWTSTFWGVAILIGLVILLAVRRRDWKAHWEALERGKKSPPEPDESEPPFV